MSLASCSGRFAAGERALRHPFLLGYVAARFGLDDFGKELNLLLLADIEPRVFSLLGLSGFTALTELTRPVAHSCCLVVVLLRIRSAFSLVQDWEENGKSCTVV
jgi:hypothetical protein